MEGCEGVALEARTRTPPKEWRNRSTYLAGAVLARPSDEQRSLRGGYNQVIRGDNPLKVTPTSNLKLNSLYGRRGA